MNYVPRGSWFRHATGLFGGHAEKRVEMLRLGTYSLPPPLPEHEKTSSCRHFFSLQDRIIVSPACVVVEPQSRLYPLREIMAAIVLSDPDTHLSIPTQMACGSRRTVWSLEDPESRIRSHTTHWTIQGSSSHLGYLEVRDTFSPIIAGCSHPPTYY